jgi:hypothetical protein
MSNGDIRELKLQCNVVAQTIGQDVHMYEELLI